jgi:hypothetical protein
MYGVMYSYSCILNHHGIAQLKIAKDAKSLRYLASIPYGLLQ